MNVWVYYVSMQFYAQTTPMAFQIIWQYMYLEYQRVLPYYNVVNCIIMGEHVFILSQNVSLLLSCRFKSVSLIQFLLLNSIYSYVVVNANYHRCRQHLHDVTSRVEIDVTCKPFCQYCCQFSALCILGNCDARPLLSHVDGTYHCFFFRNLALHRNTEAQLDIPQRKHLIASICDIVCQTSCRERVHSISASRKKSFAWEDQRGDFCKITATSSQRQ